MQINRKRKVQGLVAYCRSSHHSGEFFVKANFVDMLPSLTLERFHMREAKWQADKT